MDLLDIAMRLVQPMQPPDLYVRPAAFDNMSTFDLMDLIAIIHCLRDDREVTESRISHAVWLVNVELDRRRELEAPRNPNPSNETMIVDDRSDEPNTD